MDNANDYPFQTAVEAEEPIYTYREPNNGAGPLWCFGSTCIADAAGKVFVSGQETIPGIKPLNNVRWMLFVRDAGKWRLAAKDPVDRTREPSPIVTLPENRILMSVNPTMTEFDCERGPSFPRILEFDASSPGLPVREYVPQWCEPVTFNEHSYRNFAADRNSGEFILFQNRDYDRAYWALSDKNMNWTSGKLFWPVEMMYGKKTEIRICYYNVLLSKGAVHIFGTSDIKEPNPVWMARKKEITGREWDYDFRRLFYAWTPDIRQEPFSDWIEIASREATCGNERNCDIYVDNDGAVHFLWWEKSVDERLRNEFFSRENLVHSLNYARYKNGRREFQTIIARAGENLGSISDWKEVTGYWGRFHIASDRRLFVVFSESGKDGSGKPVTANYILLVSRDGISMPERISLAYPLNYFFNNTIRAGSPPSDTIELYGTAASDNYCMRYAAIRLK